MARRILWTLLLASGLTVGSGQSGAAQLVRSLGVVATVPAVGRPGASGPPQGSGPVSPPARVARVQEGSMVFTVWTY